MNLVQINERLKDMPLRAVEMYANGSNPQIPPYLALAELQRREKFSQQAAMGQGAAQGPMPSIKEQIERKVGLMALQQGRMQQGQQQMADQATRMPMSVPENVQPAEEQPQAENTGIANLPMKDDMYRFAGGGIIAFSGEDDSYVSSPEESANPQTEAEIAEALRRYNALRASEATRRSEESGLEEKKRADRERERQLKFLDLVSPTAAEKVRAQSSQDVGRDMRVADEMLMSTKPPVAQARPPVVQSRPSIAQARPAPAPMADTPASPKQVAMKGDPTQQTAQGESPQLPAIFTDPEYMKVLKESLQQKTPQQLFQEQQEMLKMQGITGPAGAEQERRARERQADYEAKKPTGLQDLIRVLGQAGQYKGLSGVAPAYTSLQQQRRAEDLRFREEQDRLLDAIEEKRRAEATGRAGAIREEIFKGKDIASRTAGAMTAEQMRAQADFAKQIMADKNALMRQGMSEAAAENLAGIKFDYERRLRAVPQAQRASLEEQYVEDLVRNGMTRSKAIEEARRLGTGSDKIDIDALKNMQKSLMGTLEITSGASKDERATARAQLDEVNRRLMQMAGMGAPAGGNKFTVTAGGKTYTFPTQEAANKFKAEAGVK